jgi:hypothetical protein
LVGSLGFSPLWLTITKYLQHLVKTANFNKVENIFIERVGLIQTNISFNTSFIILNFMIISMIFIAAFILTTLGNHDIYLVEKVSILNAIKFSKNLNVVLLGLISLFVSTIIIYSFIKYTILATIILSLLHQLITDFITNISWEKVLWIGEEKDFNKKIIPNQGIYQSLENVIPFTIIGTFIGAIFGSLLGLFIIIMGTLKGIDTKTLGFTISQQSALQMGVIGGFIGGFIPGFGCIQHLCLRLTLYLNGHTNWDLARFFNHCTERMMLQRVGGRYRFIHRLLQEHFAKMEIE